MEKYNTGKSNRILFMMMVLLSILVVQCTKPTTIGGDLVNENEADFWSTDTMPLTVKTVKSTDTLLTYFYASVSKTLRRYYLGMLDDPVFGRNTAKIFSQYGPYAGSYTKKFNEATVDSVVLTLVLDSAYFYGDATAMQSLNVSRLMNPMALDTNYYSNQDFPVEATPLGELIDFVPNLNKRVLYVSETIKDSNLVYLRIPLDNSFGEEILAYDSLVYVDAEAFAQKFKGISIQATSPSLGMMAVDLRHVMSEIDIYYQTPTEDSLVLPIHSLRGYAATDYQTKDYAGSYVESHIGVANDSEFFIQSTGGLNVEIELPDVSDLGNIIVNKAILEFSVKDLNFDDTSMFRLNKQLVLKDTLGNYINDVGTVLTSTGGYGVFGGKPKVVTRNGETRTIFEMNISSMLQDVIQGSLSNKVVLRPASFLETDDKYELTGLGRTVLQGFSGAKEWQPKLRLNYTEVK